MKIPKNIKQLTKLCIALLAFGFACSSSYNMLNRIPTHKVIVNVVDQSDKPIKGAQVEASNNRKTTTDENGYAVVKFGTVGVRSITVMADNYMPANVVVTMPADNGDTLHTKLTQEIQFGSFTYNTANMYPLMFNYMFSSYGYGFEFSDYKPGEWTKWSIDDGSDETLKIRKAFLKKLDNGQEWWQVKVNSGDKDQSYVAEVLFSKDRSSVRRLREKIGDGKVKEKPVAEGWYTKPVKLTEESKDAARSQEDVTISIPEGHFIADLYKFDIGADMKLLVWEPQRAQLPGGVAKYKVHDDDDKTVYESTLIDTGKGAKTELDSY